MTVLTEGVCATVFKCELQGPEKTKTKNSLINTKCVLTCVLTNSGTVY